MRHLLVAGIALSCVAVLPLRALSDEQVMMVIDRAITAHGGAEKLGKFTAEITKAKGLLYVGGGLFFSQEVQLQLPDQYRDSTILSIGGQDLPIIMVLNGDKGWVRANNETKDMDERMKTETLEGLYLARLTRLLALKDKGLELTALGESKIEGRTALGIKVTTKGRRDVSLYFDKDTGLLLKISRTAYDFENSKEVPEERIFSDYGEVDGLRLARKFVVLRDGKKFMDLEVLEARLPGKLDAEVFAKP
jgi:hypothetical protein